MVILALLCAMGATDCTAASARVVISKPANQIECAMPMQALLPTVAESAIQPGPDEGWLFVCER